MPLPHQALQDFQNASPNGRDAAQLLAYEVAANLTVGLLQNTDDVGVNWGPLYDDFLSAGTAVMKKSAENAPDVALAFFSIACTPLLTGERDVPLLRNLPIGKWCAFLLSTVSGSVDPNEWICAKANRWLHDPWSTQLLERRGLPIKKSEWPLELTLSAMDQLDPTWNDDYAQGFMTLTDYAWTLEKIFKRKNVSPKQRAFVAFIKRDKENLKPAITEPGVGWKPTFNVVKKYLPERLGTEPQDFLTLFSALKNWDDELSAPLSAWLSGLDADELRTLYYVAFSAAAYPFHIENSFRHAYPKEELVEKNLWGPAIVSPNVPI